MFLKDKIQAHHDYEKENGTPKAIPIVIDIAKKALEAGIKIGCATSGLREAIDSHMKSSGIDGLFEVVVCAAEVAKGKPAPDVYLEAAKRLGVDPTKCRAYEDGESGMASAWAAGMQVIDVKNMEGYPMSDVLRKRVEDGPPPRPWLKYTYIGDRF